MPAIVVAPDPEPTVQHERYAHFLRTVDYAFLATGAADLALMLMTSSPEHTARLTDQLQMVRAERDSRPEAAAAAERRHQWCVAAAAARRRTAAQWIADHIHPADRAALAADREHRRPSRLTRHTPVGNGRVIDRGIW